jgi:hypothetical protein
MLIDRNHPYFFGHVLPPAGPILEGTEMEAFYVAPLMYFGGSERDFSHLKIDEIDVLFSWLVPIYKPEVEWIHRKGGDAFEDLIVEQDPDLMDLNRPPLVEFSQMN